MKKYEVYVKTPNKFLNVKNKMVRTPTKFVIGEDEVDKYKSIFSISGIDNFTINDYYQEQTIKLNTQTIEKIENQPAVKKAPDVEKILRESEIKALINEESVEDIIEEANAPKKRGRKKQSTLDTLSE